MRICFIGPFGIRPKGTVSARMLPIAREMAARGHRVRVILPPYDHLGDSGRQWRDGRVAIHNVLLPEHRGALHHATLALRLSRAALLDSPDILHLFKPKGYGGLACQWLLRLPRARRPALLVDADDWEGMGGWNNLGGYSRSYQRLFAWQERELLRRADGVTAASHVLVRLATTLRRSDERLWRVPNGCGVSTVAPGCPGQQPTVLIFSRLHDLDPMVVVDTLATILRRRPHVRVCVAGGQLHGEEVRWKAALQVAGIAGAVHLLGWIDPTLLPGLLQMTSVALVPTANTLVNRSRCSAKLGVLLSSGVPVVATAVGENSTYIRQDVDGVLVDPGNVMALALATLHLLDSAPLRARLGNSAARRMREEFSWPLIADTVERAYQTCYSTGEHLKKGRSRR